MGDWLYWPPIILFTYLKLFLKMLITLVYLLWFIFWCWCKVLYLSNLPQLSLPSKQMELKHKFLFLVDLLHVCKPVNFYHEIGVWYKLDEGGVEWCCNNFRYNPTSLSGKRDDDFLLPLNLIIWKAERDALVSINWFSWLMTGARIFSVGISISSPLCL